MLPEDTSVIIDNLKIIQIFQLQPPQPRRAIFKWRAIERPIEKDLKMNTSLRIIREVMIATILLKDKPVTKGLAKF